MKIKHIILGSLLISFTPSLFSHGFSTQTSSIAPEAKPKQPNILFIVSEDNGPELGCYGAPVKTPNLDQLAAEGIRFQKAYVAQAGCSPSRAAFLTGLYPHQNGQIALATWNYSMYNEHTPNLVNDLKKSGYITGNIGKIHVNPESAFDFDLWVLRGGNFKRKNMGDYADSAYHFLTSSDKPFYLQVNYPDAHDPFLPQVNGMPAEVLTGKDVEPLPYFGVTSDSLRQKTADYYNCIMRLDELIGHLLEKLKKSGKYENTMIVYIGDHGADMLRGKRTCYEGGVNIPMIISWPNHGKKGLVSWELVSTIDLYPTFMDISGNKIPSYITGKSLVPLIKGEAVHHRDYLFTEYHTHSNHNPYPQRSVRDERYKLIHNLVPGHENPGYYYTIGKKINPDDFNNAVEKAPEAVQLAYENMKMPLEFELYDLKSDPNEWNNLAGKKEYVEVFLRLKKVLRTWQEETTDPMIDPELAKRFYFDVVNSDLKKKKPIPYHEYLDPKLNFK